MDETTDRSDAVRRVNGARINMCDTIAQIFDLRSVFYDDTSNMSKW